MLAPSTLAPPPPGLLDGASLFLDFDGTLVALAPRPDAVVVAPELRTLLHRVGAALGGRVAIVSGRSVEQVDAFLGDAIADWAVVGSHGAEIRERGGAVTRPDRPHALDAAERAFRDRFGDTDGVVIEVKSLGVAIHYRLAPAVEDEARALVERFAGEEGLAVQHGKMMAELRMPGHDKGTAIRSLATRAPFAETRPVFAGDDLTDEAGFAAVAELGGAGVLVGPDRETAARYRLDDVAAVLRWLEALA